MKLTRFTQILVIGLVLTVAASGCRKQPVAVTTLPGQKTGEVKGPGSGEPLTPGQGTEPGTQGIASNPPGSHEGWTENGEVLKAHTVHFALDSAVVKAAEKVNVTAVAEYLKANPAAAVRVEGHCDERGTAEYNSALGERRALAVREDLHSMGIEATRVDTKTWGFEKPVATGHDESAWKMNRRAEFILLTPPAK
jgi:peptidoglycan-associated lipoprotein